MVRARARATSLAESRRVHRSPCSNSTDTKFGNIFLRKELWVLYVSKRLVRNLLSKFAWLVNGRALQALAVCVPSRALALYPGAEISIIPGGRPKSLTDWGLEGEPFYQSFNIAQHARKNAVILQATGQATLTRDGTLLKKAFRGWLGLRKKSEP